MRAALLLCCFARVAAPAAPATPVAPAQLRLAFGSADLDDETGERLARFEEYSGEAFEGFLGRIPGIHLIDRTRVKAAILQQRQQQTVTSSLSEDPAQVGKIATTAGVRFLFTGTARQYTAAGGEESLTVELVVVDATTSSYVFRRTYTTRRPQGPRRGHRELLDAILTAARPDLTQLVADLGPRVVTDEAAAAEAARRRKDPQRAEEAKRAEAEHERQAAEQRSQREASERAVRDQPQRQPESQAHRQQQETQAPTQAEERTRSARAARHPAQARDQTPQPAAAERQSAEFDALVKRADQLYDKRDYAAALPLYRQAAAQGQPHALMQVGFCFDLGYGVESDSAAALPWYQKAVAAGDPEAMAYLGGLYEEGTGVERDYGRAMALYRRSADAGEPAGMNKLGSLYSAGHGVPKDPAEAVRWYRKAADLGYSWAMNNLGSAYIAGSGVPKNQRQALEWFRKAAEVGNDEAMTALGEAYAHGELTAPRDLTIAATWFKKAIALDNDKARQLLARLGRPIYDLTGVWEGYYLFQGLPEVIRIVQDGDSITATRLHTLDLSPMNMPFFRGSRVGDSQKADIEIAQYSMLGMLFTALQGTSPLSALGGPSGWTPATLFIADPDQIHLGPTSAFERISAPRPDDLYCDLGNPLRVRAKYAFARGKIAQATQHYKTAACWYSIGIAQDSARARSGMGDLLRYGLGVKKNPEWARSWFDKAAASGDPYGAQSIAEMYDRGELARDPETSSFWHAQARAIKEQQTKLIAARRRQAEKDRAVMVLLTGAASVASQSMVDALTSDPECDVRQVAENGARIPGSIDQTLARNRDRLLASGQIYCGSPIDLSPMVKINKELKAYEERTLAADERR